ncbi:MAG: hypothetical protein AAF721_28970 [Myxococcota bacterium]
MGIRCGRFELTSVLAGIVTLGCGPSLPGNESDALESASGDGSGGAAAASVTGGTGLDVGVAGWPEQWYGEYWLRVLDPGTVVNAIGTLTNLELTESGVVWEQIRCRPEALTETIPVVYSPVDVVVVPWDPTWFPIRGVSAAILRPPNDGDCGQLVMVVVDDGGEEIGSFEFERGRQFVFDDCSDGPGWGVELDPDVETTCEN